MAAAVRRQRPSTSRLGDRLVGGGQPQATRVGKAGLRPGQRFDSPPIYLGSTTLGLHAVLIGVREHKDAHVGVSLLTWTDRSAGLTFYRPAFLDAMPANMRDSYHWSQTDRHPESWDIHWYPLPEDTAHVEFTVEDTVVQSIRPTSRVALVQAVLSYDEVWHLLKATAYDSAGQPLLVKPPKYPSGPRDVPRHGDA